MGKQENLSSEERQRRREAIAKGRELLGSSARKLKVDETKLAELLRQGRTHEECAQYFGCSAQAIQKHVNKLKQRGIDIEVGESQDQIVATLNKVRKAVNREFDWLKGLTENNTISEEARKENLKIIIDTSAEIRAQEKLVVEIFKTLYEMRVINEYKKTIGVIIDAINAETCPNCLERVSNRIREAGDLERNIGDISKSRVAAP